MRNAIASATITHLVKLRIDAVRICIDQNRRIGEYHNNATEYVLTTREDTSIILSVNT